jgi:hypothetical protein
MVLGLWVAAALLADPPAVAAANAPPTTQVADHGADVVAEPSEPQASTAEPNCAAQAVANPNAIVVCAQRPQGYRLNRDVMEAKRDKRRQDAGRPTRPGTMTDNSCEMVGPMGCRGMIGINVLAAAATAAEMAARISRGEEIGSMFVTDPQKSEYELYVEAKRRREAAEAEAAAKAKTKATVEP